MASVTVDVELDEFDDDEIFSEAIERINRTTRSGKIERLLTALKPLIGEIKPDQINVKSLDDKMKLEHLSRVWYKYSCLDIETLLPE